MKEHDDETCAHTSYCPYRAELAPRFIGALTKKTYAMVLAGGRGSRLQQMTDWRAKPAVPFGGKLRIIDFPLSNCINSGIRRIGVATQYMAHSLIHHIQRGWSFLDDQFNEFIDVLPAQQRVKEGWYEGTANAVFQNLDILRSCAPEYVLILCGDHVYKMDYSRILADHVAKAADVTVACIEVPRAEGREFGIIGVDEEGRVTYFHEKPEHPAAMPGRPDSALASMGIYVFGARFLYEQLIRDHDDPESGHDFGKDLIPYLVTRNRVIAHRFADSCVNMVGDVPYWRDVGTVDAYWEANMDLVQVTPELNLYDDAWPIWTHQKQLPPAKFIFNNDRRRGHAMDSLISSGCIISGATIERSLLFLKVYVGDYSLIQDSVILPNVEIGRHVTLKRVVVDKHCKIPDGFSAGIVPERDKQCFHVTERGITLITPEMLGQTVHRVR
ncbi:glucose-1-phosphate adenylyltransferase [Sulfuricella denitrificans skB26]|uniref:Glucose-1-phosphate adenylyltransferase n=2 Tax=Sulfuricella denitrificans TaxID=649841 RepID=S6ACS0_SULDS|nr:glucose-1-phosphate adenylyltransferase [Sulfuricella denitrificans]BAN35803.1 glucose-1-phosphate adenylyltransferase [Sulfuricella denitrificans skB26]